MFILTCTEIEAQHPCCPGCLLKTDDRTMVYPAGLYSGPDQSMGIKAFVCCHHIHYARGLTRAWWLTKMMRLNKRYTEQDIVKLVSVVDNELLYYKVWGSLHETVRARETTTKAVAKPRTRSSNCPDCSSEWNQIVCNNCGRTGV
jgi:hypothetical protein